MLIALSRSAQLEYSETQVAKELGVSLIQLRALIRSHVAERDEDLNNVSATAFRASDLVMLRLLMSRAQPRLLES